MMGMGRKSVSRLALGLVLTVIVILAFNGVLAREPGLGFAGGATGMEDPPLMSPPTPTNRTFFQQNFDNETPGAVPIGWVVNPSSVGSFTVDNSTDCAVPGRNSAKFIDNSSIDTVTAFRYFAQQNGTIVFSFSVNLPYSIGNHTGLEVSVDDGSLNGSNIIFKDGAIEYFDGNKGLVTLRSWYVANKWYRIKFIMNILGNIYNVHIDDHLEVGGARFNGSCSQIQRIAITEYSPPSPPGSMMPVGYIDDIIGTGALTIPFDYPTIQAGIDAASPGDLVYVTGPRVYFEDAKILPKKNGIWLVGQDVNSVVIDGKFARTMPFRLTLMGCSNVTIYGFTIRSSAEDGAQICVNGSGNTITDNLIANGSSDGIRVTGSNSIITDNVIQANRIGINIISGQGNLVNNNTIVSNTVGLQCRQNASNSLIYGNRFVSNDQQALDNGVSNRWDNGYPYVPANMTGGGNYWSDLNNCTDVRSGPNQDQSINCTWPLPDGICDRPYKINSGWPFPADRYPLFLIQSVTQNPQLTHANCALQIFDRSVEYKNNVTVTATALKFVRIINASLCVDYTNVNGTTHVKITGQVSGNNLTFTIPRQAYNTTVRYNISALADGANWLNSTSYPIPFPYFVDDMTPPNIGNISYVPVGVNESQAVAVFATVTEDVNASGIYKVFVSYPVNITWWTAEMTWVGNNSYTATIPRQPGGTTLTFNVTAVDKAGNLAGPGTNSTYVKKLAQMLVNAANPIPFDPCSIDKGDVSGDQTFSVSFNVTNLSGAADEPLIWNLTRIKDGAWLTSISPGPTNGVVPGGQTIHVTVSIDTHKCTDPGLYIAEFAVNASGTVPQWAVIITFSVKTIIIDASWASVQWPSRVDVGTTEYVAFHAEWAINCSDATGGAIRITGNNTYQPVNATGWATVPVNSSTPAKTTFGVEGVKFGFVTSFAQRAQSPTVAWDRVKIVLKMGNDNYTNVDSAANISWNGSSFYELDKTSFQGSVLFNDSLIRDHVDVAWITTSSIIDYKYGLTAFESSSVDVIWDEIKIIAGGVSHSQTAVNQTEYVWFIAVYELENTLFKGENGSLYVSDGTKNSAMDWSSDDKDMWRRDFSYPTSGDRTFEISGVRDDVHHLIKIRDGVGPLSIMWGERPWWEVWWPTSQKVTMANDPAQLVQPVQTQGAEGYAALAVVIVVIVVMGILFTLFLLMSSGKKSRSSINKKKAVRTNHENKMHPYIDTDEASQGAT
jgi:hypothetical protein